MCIKLNLQNPVVSHWSDNVCNSKTERLDWKVQPWGQFLLLWCVRNYAPASLVLMSCINNVLCQWWLATDCFEMDNHNFHLHSLEDTAYEGSDSIKKKYAQVTKSTYSKSSSRWSRPLADYCKANSFRLITRAKFLLAVGPSHVQEWTNHPERHDLCSTECDSLRDLANGPTF